MSDERLRELERRWKETGCFEDEVALFVELARSGLLAKEIEEIQARVSSLTNNLGDRRVLFAYATLDGQAQVAWRDSPLGGGRTRQPVIDAFLEEHGLARHADSDACVWRDLDPDHASSVLEFLLHADLCYGARRFGLPGDQARDTARRVLSLFQSRVRCFSHSHWNTDPRTTTSQSYTPLTSATLEAGLVLCDGERIGFLWVMDED